MVIESISKYFPNSRTVRSGQNIEDRESTLSTNKERRQQKRKSKNKAARAYAATQPKPFSREQIPVEIDRLVDPRKLTTPSEITEDIVKFCQTISESNPFFIQCTPELWSRQSCCEQNVEEYISLHGGESLFGYKIWAHLPHYIEAERHAIWKSGDTTKDVSFNADGEESILFLPDAPSRQGSLDDNKPRYRWGKDANTKTLIAYLEMGEQGVQKMTKEKSWNTMLTYEQWLSGRRMSNVLRTQRI